MKRDLMGSKQRGTGNSHVTRAASKAVEHPLDEKQARAFLNSMQGKSQAELQQEFFATAQKQMQNGQYDEAAMKRMMDSVAPMLSHEQRAKMEQMLSMLHKR